MIEMNQAFHLAIDLVIIAILIVGIWLFRFPRRARMGNSTAAFALACAFVLVLLRHGIVDPVTVIISLIIGSTIGYAVARSVNMIQIPSMVAFQNGMGGIAACIISLLELIKGGGIIALTNQVSGILGLTIGALTFSGSMIASAKLAGKIRQTPQVLPGHSAVVCFNIGLLLLVGMVALFVSPVIGVVLFVAQIIFGLIFGVLFSIRIGGADMPVLISFLNAGTGLAAAFCGIVIENQLLIVFGATVAASGSILTYVMCKAMNRSLYRIFIPIAYQSCRKRDAERDPLTQNGYAPQEMPDAVSADRAASLATAVSLIQNAQSVIIVPGYGMALSRAHQEVAALADEMLTRGKTVKYAIHPVAGRMPGHMNILLAEAGVDYDCLVAPDDANSRFPSTDLVLIVGACDVVNPAVIDAEAAPLSGLPILFAHKARHVVCCNADLKPGYSGVENELYKEENVLVLTGDAKETVSSLMSRWSGEKLESKPETAEAPGSDNLQGAAAALISAKRIIIVPGYGMAISRAQFKVVELASLLSETGREVFFAIHPVAGRMPGHMNVILAEAEVDYEKLLDMNDVNPLFSITDAVLVFGACDVVNPAAIEQAGTPISGMPILMAHEASRIIICNFDRKPGYSGVENILYENEKSILLLGDARETAIKLIERLQKTLVSG